MSGEGPSTDRAKAMATDELKAMVRAAREENPAAFTSSRVPSASARSRSEAASSRLASRQGADDASVSESKSGRSVGRDSGVLRRTGTASMSDMGAPARMPGPKSRAMRTHTDMWTGLSLLEQGLNELSVMSKAVDDERSKLEFRRGLDEQRAQQERDRARQREEDERATRLAAEHAEALLRRQTEELRKRVARASEFKSDAGDVQANARWRKEEMERERQAAAREDLARVREIAAQDRQEAAAKARRMRAERTATKQANLEMMAAKRMHEKLAAEKERAELEEANAQLAAREEARLEVVRQRKAAVKAKLAAMAAEKSDRAAAERAAAARADRELLARHAREDEAQRLRDEERRHVIAEEKTFLIAQMAEHDVAKRRRRQEERDMLMAAEADAHASHREAEAKRLEQHRRKVQHGEALVAQMREAAAARSSSDDSALERALNAKMLRKKREELEARAAELLSTAPDHLLKSSGVVDRVRRSAAKLEQFQEGELRESATNVLRRLDETQQRFASPPSR
ncbi:hypothetical protein FNF27_01922 [Cafeteria roenbergensis]|nr:hypothetical protein FNF27_01922 [Cafeteria roenbergensis]